MKIIEKWKEPPFVETPEPKIGGVVKALNTLEYTAQKRTEDFNNSTTENLKSIRAELDKFLVELPLELDILFMSTG